MELRHITASDSGLSTRSVAGGGAVLEGYAAVWDSPSEIIGGEDHGFIEYVRRGAFTRSLKERDARALHSHSSEYVLGRVSSGTLQLNEDDRGLHFRVRLPDNELINGLVVEPVRRRDITGMSFGFNIRPGGESWKLVDGRDTRSLTDLLLVEISTTGFPAYPGTSVDLAGAAARSTRSLRTPMRLAKGRRMSLSDLQFKIDTYRAIAVRRDLAAMRRV